MPESRSHKVTPPRESGGAASACKTALAVTYKALKAFSFYPEDHPLRQRILVNAHHAMANAAKDGVVSLIVNRNGFSFADQKAPIETTPLTKALAQELFAREIQRLIVLPEISPTDYTKFLSLLALDPPKISAAGGLAAMLKQHGVQTVALDEIDISAVFTRKKGEQLADEGAAQAAPPEQGSGSESGPTEAEGVQDRLSQMSSDELIAQMSKETDDNRFRQLARLLLAKVLPLKVEKEFDRLFVVLVALAQQASEPQRSVASRGQAAAVVQQLALGEVAEHLLDHLEDGEFRQKEVIHLILKTVGGEVVDAVIRRLIAAGMKASRKPLTTALLQLGPAAEPALVGLLKDGRWQVVTAAIAILAELGSRDAVKGLMLTAYHSDNRVRMESIRALAGIGGMEASATLIDLLHDPNQAIGVHAITWLGNSRNQRALQPLLQLVLKRDFPGKTRALKKEALLAIGRIGDRRALDQLFRLVRKHYWIFPSRWDELKRLAVEAIGNLGGEPAREFLMQVSSQGGHLGRIAAAALESMAKRDHENNE